MKLLQWFKSPEHRDSLGSPSGSVKGSVASQDASREAIDRMVTLCLQEVAERYWGI